MTKTPIDGHGGIFGHGGNYDDVSKGDKILKSVNLAGGLLGGDGGNLHLESTDGKVEIAGSIVTMTSGDGSGGAVRIKAKTSIDVGVIDTGSLTFATNTGREHAGGDVRLEAGGTIRTRDISTASSTETAGAIYIHANMDKVESAPFVIGGKDNFNGVNGTINMRGAFAARVEVADRILEGPYLYVRDDGSGVVLQRYTAIKNTTQVSAPPSVILAADRTVKIVDRLWNDSLYANEGGKVILSASVVDLSSAREISAYSLGGKGGAIAIAADTVLFGMSTTIDVSGITGGVIVLRPKSGISFHFIERDSTKVPFIIESHGSPNGPISLVGSSVDTARLTLQANGQFAGGIIQVESLTLAIIPGASSGVVTLQANALSNGSGGTVSVISSLFDNRARMSIAARGSGLGEGGRVTFSTRDDLSIGNGTGEVSFDARGGNSADSTFESAKNRIEVFANDLTVNPSGLILTAGIGKSGVVLSMTAEDTMTLNSNIIANGNGTGNGGKIFLRASTLNLGSSTVTTNSGPDSGKGGVIQLSANTFVADQFFVLRSNGVTSGGAISMVTGGEGTFYIAAGRIEARGTNILAAPGAIALESSAAIHIGKDAVLNVSTIGIEYGGGNVLFRGRANDFTLTVDGTITTTGPVGRGRVIFNDPSTNLTIKTSGIINSRLYLDARMATITNTRATSSTYVQRVNAPGEISIVASGPTSLIALEGSGNEINGSRIYLQSSKIDVSDESGVGLHGANLVELSTNSFSNGNISLGSQVLVDSGIISIITHGTGRVIQGGSGALTVDGFNGKVSFNSETGAIGTSLLPIIVSAAELAFGSSPTTNVNHFVQATSDTKLMASSMGAAGLTLACEDCYLTISESVHLRQLTMSIAGSGGVIIDAPVTATSQIRLSAGQNLGSIDAFSNGSLNSPLIVLTTSNGNIGGERLPINVDAGKLILLAGSGSVFLTNRSLAESQVDATVNSGNLNLSTSGALLGKLNVPNGAIELSSFGLGRSGNRLSVTAQSLTFEAEGNVYLTAIASNSLSLHSSRAASIDILGSGTSLIVPVFNTLQANAGDIRLHSNSLQAKISISGELTASSNVYIYSGTLSTTGLVRMSPGIHVQSTGSVETYGDVMAPPDFAGLRIFGHVNALSAGGSSRILIEADCAELFGAQIKSGNFSPIAFCSGSSPVYLTSDGAEKFVSTEAALFLTGPNNMHLRSGEILLSPRKNIIVRIGDLASVALQAGAMCLMSADENDISVINLFDRRNGSVVATIFDRTIAVMPGRCLKIVSPNQKVSARYAQRNVSSINLSSVKLEFSEVSLPDILHSNALLKQVRREGHKPQIERIMRMAACLAATSSARGAYRR